MALFFPGSATATEAFAGTLSAFVVEIRFSSWTAPAIYLEEERFITVAHVVGQTIASPNLVIAGGTLPLKILKKGSFETTDLAVLIAEKDKLPMRFRLRRLPRCAGDPKPGQQVITLAPNGAALSSVLSVNQIPQKARQFKTIIADKPGTGNSGAGVFDLEQQCFLGIISRKISNVQIDQKTGKQKKSDLAKYFVPIGQIVNFLRPGDAR